MLVGGNASYSDAFAGYPFSSEAGDLLDHILFKLGHSRSEIYTTQLIKCSPKKDTLPKGKALEPYSKACWPYLQDEINWVRPKVIVPMGSMAVKAMTGIQYISRADGYPLTAKPHTYVPCYHPNAVLQAPHLEKNIAHALAKAFGLAGMGTKPEGKGLIFNYKDIERVEI